MPDRQVQLPASWMAQVGEQFDAPYMRKLREFLAAQKRAGKVVFPAGKDIFAAFNAAEFEAVKVVIIGQDPYHGPGQAHGLSFSVRPGVPVPPSLINIYQEVNDDLGALPDAHEEGGTEKISGARRLNSQSGDLTAWAKQGVLLLNSVLTVEQSRAGSHQGKGWETFTDAVVAALNAQREKLVFLLWGAYAQKKGGIVDEQRHCVLRAPHPSPLAAYRGFFGCRHFSQTNRYLQRHGLEPIDWFKQQDSL